MAQSKLKIDTEAPFPPNNLSKPDNIQEGALPLNLDNIAVTSNSALAKDEEGTSKGKLFQLSSRNLLNAVLEEKDKSSASKIAGDSISLELIPEEPASGDVRKSERTSLEKLQRPPDSEQVSYGENEIVIKTQSKSDAIGKEMEQKASKDEMIDANYIEHVEDRNEDDKTVTICTVAAAFDKLRESTSDQDYCCPFGDDGPVAKLKNKIKKKSSTKSTENLKFSNAELGLDGTKSCGSILDKPFIFRNAASLDAAVRSQEERDLKAMYLLMARQRNESAEEMLYTDELHDDSITSSITKTISTPCEPSVDDDERSRLEYFIELDQRGEEEGDKDAIGKKIIKEVPSISEESEIQDETKAMKMARKYLRIHKIFEFYQFLIGHILANLPDNPIDFLLDLLDKCIMYRASMGSPPVLYEKKHIGALFNLMDPMSTGYIDYKQYERGLQTIGICNSNNRPNLIKSNLIPKDVFVDEAYDMLVCILDELLKRRWIDYKAGTMLAAVTTPPPTLTKLLSSIKIKPGR